ncbi:MAG: hypothetical protein ACYC0H_03695 [Solirubrobacteraceae bacterium]
MNLSDNQQRRLAVVLGTTPEADDFTPRLERLSLDAPRSALVPSGAEV